MITFGCDRPTLKVIIFLNTFEKSVFFPMSATPHCQLYIWYFVKVNLANSTEVKRHEGIPAKPGFEIAAKQSGATYKQGNQQQSEAC